MSYAIAITAAISLEQASQLAHEATDQDLIHLLDQAIGLALGHRNCPDQCLFYDIASVFRSELQARRRWW